MECFSSEKNDHSVIFFINIIGAYQSDHTNCKTLSDEQWTLWRT